MKRILALISLPLLIASCQAKPFLKESMPLLATEGAVFVYLAPLPPDARRLSFRVKGIYAERAGGGQIAIPLKLEEIEPKEVGRERLLAYGPLPAGGYAGLSLKVARATLKGEEGPSSLRVQEEPTEIPVPFTVEGKRAVVLKLALRYRESVREGFGFAPDMIASIQSIGELPVGRLGMATSRGANTVTVFDKITGQVVSVIPTGKSPSGLVVDTVRNRAYVALAGEDALETIDLLEGREIERLTLMAGDAPVELALTPDGRALLSANSGSNTVSVVDPLSMIETSRIPVGLGPRFLVLTRTGQKAYVFNGLSNTISVLDVPTAAVTGTISTEAGPVAGQLNRDESLLYVIQQGYPYIGAFNTGSLVETSRIRVGIEAASLKVDSRTDRIYLSRRNSPDVDVYEPLSLLPMETVGVGGEVANFAIDGEEGNLWIVLPESDRLLAVRQTGKRIVAEVDVGDDPRRVAVFGER